MALLWLWLWRPQHSYHTRWGLEFLLEEWHVSALRGRVAGRQQRLQVMLLLLPGSSCCD
jgi:hypothetical protein